VAALGSRKRTRQDQRRASVTESTVAVFDPLGTARYLAVAVQTLARWRCYGGGPPFVRLGGRKIGYRVAALDAWLVEQERRSTSERA
jgi:hypothetical protein